MLFACCLLLTACNDPTLVLPGGKLSGAIAAPPAEWQFAEPSQLAQLETRPQDPYSINLVYVQLNGQLYVYAGNTRTTWVQHIEQNPLVRIRINDVIYPVRAVRVEEQQELTGFAEFWASRSFFQRDPMDFDEVWLYRLHAR